MTCPNCELYVPVKNIKTSVYNDFIEIVINCKKCKQAHYTQVDCKDFKKQ